MEDKEYHIRIQAELDKRLEAGFEKYERQNPGTKISHFIRHLLARALALFEKE